MKPAGLAFIGLLALQSVGCSSEPNRVPIGGTWLRGGISGDHFGAVVMQLTQDGERITGVACAFDSGHLIFTGTPVVGRYPWVAFEYFGRRARGRIIDEDTIAMHVQSTGSDDVSFGTWYFDREPKAVCPAATTS